MLRNRWPRNTVTPAVATIVARTIDSHPLEWEDTMKKILATDWYEGAMPLGGRRYCGLWGRGT
jgi:hypothetical protein